jgi:hypothetical protein
MMLVRTPRSFYVLRFLLGAAEAGFFLFGCGAGVLALR